MPFVRARMCAALLVMSALLGGFSLSAQSPKTPAEVVPNDNRTAAGVVRDGVLQVKLEVGYGVWYPDGHQASGIVVQTFSEAGQAPRIPGPLLRIATGTRVHAVIHNTLQMSTVVLHGFGAHDGVAAPVVTIAPGASRTLDFEAGQPGDYLYWASTTSHLFDKRPFGVDAVLTGALVIDPPGPVEPDRIFVINSWRDPSFLFGFKATAPAAMSINGLSWPDTERLTYHVGDHVRWQVIDATDDPHPMHLHGFHFQVVAASDGEVSQRIPRARRMWEDTRLIWPGGAITMDWTPTLPGHWMYHCHVLDHIAPELMETREFPGEGGMDRAAQAAAMGGMSMHDMGGLVLGIDVLPSPAHPVAPELPVSHRLRLYVRSMAGGRLGYALAKGDGTVGKTQSPGPPVILYRGQTTRITIVNQMRQATSLHWHGMTLRSYFDGVPYWSGNDKKQAPPIGPGQSFSVTITPPLAGTFLYHSHWNDDGQLMDGLYGPLLVLKPGQKFDPVHDRIFIAGEIPTRPTGQVAFNGSVNHPVTVLKAGQSYRFRMINITRNLSGLIFAWRRVQPDGSTTPVDWLPIAKDGANLPKLLRQPEPNRVISVGEKLDALITPQPGDYVLVSGYSVIHPEAEMKFHVER